jgi:hypothetical protein
MVLVTAKEGGGPAVRQWPKTLKIKQNLMGDYLVRVHSGQMVLVVVWQGGLTTITLAKGAHRELENNSMKPRDPLKNRLSVSLKKNQLTLSQGMLKKGNVDDDAVDDDEVRTTVSSQDCATATLKTEEFFLRTRYL